MSVKVFISYCQKDDEYREGLESHLSLMKRNKIIESWSDRKIVAGQEWDHEINKNMENASIILLLVSSDFIGSDYCFDIEVKKAIERHEAREAVVIPIIVRTCDWASAPFGKIEALPNKAKPVKKWSDRDDAWLNVVEGIKEAVQKINTESNKVKRKAKLWDKKLGPIFRAWLNDTEIKLLHRNVTSISLSDLYVLPHLKALKSEFDEIVEAKEVKYIFDTDQNFLVFSDEQVGKTSFIKHLFRRFLELGHMPLLLNGEFIKNADPSQLIEKSFFEQYQSKDYSDFIDSPKKVLLIDDFSKLKLNKKYANLFSERVIHQFDKCIFTASESYQYVVPEIEELDNFGYLEILAFGNVKRAELVKKWVSLGTVEQIEDKDLYEQCDDIKLKLDTMVKGNIVPPKPIYLLMFLQMMEAYTPQKLDLTSYGHCYQFLVYQALEKVKIKNNEIDKYLNVLTELAWAQYENNGLGLTENELNLFFDHYEIVYLKVNRANIINNFLSSSILVKNINGIISFKYPYIFYFFAAKKFAETFNDSEEVKEKIRILLANLHKEDSANIIIFIAHHTKENWILDEIQICLLELFEDQKEATLDKESLSFMDDFIKEIPELVLENREIEKERQQYNESLDGNKPQDLADNSNDGLEPTDILANINRVFKGIEIVGQIVRNRHASLKKDILLQIVEYATSTGLRFLHFFINISDISRDEVVKTIEHILKEHPTMQNKDIEKEARTAFLFLIYGVIYGVIKKISSSIGSKEADEIYNQLEQNNPTPAIQLINQAIGLQFKKELDYKKLTSLAKNFESNPTCKRILKEIVIQHAYMYPVDYKDKQRIAEALDIAVSGQRLIEMKKKFKM